MEWLNRSVVVPNVYYALCVDKKTFYKELKNRKIEHKQKFISFGKGATVHIFEDNKDNTICIVCINPTKSPGIKEYALLVHEAMHIWEEVMKDLSEKFPSSEFAAYTIQTISHSLMKSYKKQCKKKYASSNSSRK